VSQNERAKKRGGGKEREAGRESLLFIFCPLPLFISSFHFLASFPLFISKKREDTVLLQVLMGHSVVVRVRWGGLAKVVRNRHALIRLLKASLYLLDLLPRRLRP
jgi:hypothetical protein